MIVTATVFASQLVRRSVNAKQTLTEMQMVIAIDSKSWTGWGFANYDGMQSRTGSATAKKIAS